MYIVKDFGSGNTKFVKEELVKFINIWYPLLIDKTNNIIQNIPNKTDKSKPLDIEQILEDLDSLSNLLPSQ